ncbi:MAG: ribonuclease D [Saprospiraceae bacterium]
MQANLLKMSAEVQNYTIIETFEGLEAFYEENKSVEWLGFDTEFVGEKRYHTLLCLIQISTINGYFLIDPIKLKDVSLFLKLLEDPNIIKITHAGENDYRLIKKNYDVLPRNIFDIQVAAGFVGYKYPISFGKIVEKEAKVFLSKGYTVSDWESRPFNQKQLKYALDDVVYLKQIYDRLRAKLETLDRLEWVEEEFKKMETAEYYYIDPLREAFQNSLILGLSSKEQVFLIRIYEWRRSEAERKDYSKEMVLPAKYIGAIVRNVKSGKGSLLNHRRIPNKIIENNWDKFLEIYNRPITEEELALLENIPPPTNDYTQEDTLIEMLSLIIRYICDEKKIAPDLVIPRSGFKKMKGDSTFFDESYASGWRKKLLGETMINWLRNRGNLYLILEDDRFTLRFKE